MIFDDVTNGTGKMQKVENHCSGLWKLMITDAKLPPLIDTPFIKLTLLMDRPSCQCFICLIVMPDFNFQGKKRRLLIFSLLKGAYNEWGYAVA